MVTPVLGANVERCGAQAWFHAPEVSQVAPVRPREDEIVSTPLRVICDSSDQVVISQLPEPLQDEEFVTSSFLELGYSEARSRHQLLDGDVGFPFLVGRVALFYMPSSVSSFQEIHKLHNARVFVDWGTTYDLFVPNSRGNVIRVNHIMFDYAEIGQLAFVRF